MSEVDVSKVDGAETELIKEDIIELERKLAKFSGFMDTLVRIPFTKQGVGADAVLSTIPFAGDITGLIMTGYAFKIGNEMGVPKAKMIPAVRLAILDLFIGFIPIVGTIVDIFLQPSRRTLEIVHKHIAATHNLPNDFHVRRPYLQKSLERRQVTSKFWRNKIVEWIWLHIPDFIGLVVLIFIGWMLFKGVTLTAAFFSWLWPG